MEVLCEIKAVVHSLEDDCRTQDTLWAFQMQTIVDWGAMMAAHQICPPPVSLEGAQVDILIILPYPPRMDPSIVHTDHPLLGTIGIASIITMVNEGLRDNTQFLTTLDS